MTQMPCLSIVLAEMYNQSRLDFEKRKNKYSSFFMWIRNFMEEIDFAYQMGLKVSLSLIRVVPDSVKFRSISENLTWKDFQMFPCTLLCKESS
jgi:hypothetical protein